MAGRFQFQFVFSFLYAVFLFVQVNGRVVELDDSFRELKKSGYWFVEFYAPWCGHCKQLEPIWEEVGLELMNDSPVVIAKLDCTKFRDLAGEIGIRGFPTIKFFRGEVFTTYRGSRTKEALIEFAVKASRPILTEFKTSKEFEEKRIKPDVFFLFVKDESKTSEEYMEIVKEIAENKIAHAMFYTIMSADLPKDIKLEKVPNILVFKQNLYTTFEAEDESLNKTSLASWVDREKFLPFLLVSESNVDELADSGKMIVFATFAKDSEKKAVNKRLGEVVKELSIQMNTQFGKHFQFTGLFEREIIESIMMSTTELPFILVLEPVSRVYYILPSSALSESFDMEQLASFLKDVLDGKATAYGGRTFSQRMFRIWWDIRSSAQDIWNSSPFMALMIFGLPFLVFTFLIVMLCCLEPAPDNEEYEEEMEGQEEEKNVSGTIPEDKPTRLKAD